MVKKKEEKTSWGKEEGKYVKIYPEEMFSRGVLR